MKEGFQMENQIMQEVLMFTAMIAPIVLGLVEAVKRTVRLPNNLLPALSLVIGVLLGLAAYPFTDMEPILRIWAGAYAGLGGTGIYETLKNRPGMTK